MTEYTRDYFKLHTRACRVRKILAPYEEIWSAAQRKNILMEEELKARGYVDAKDQPSFDVFYERCEQFSLFCWPSDLAELGSGVVLYFHFLAYLAGFLFVAFLIQVPAMVAYANVDRLDAWVFSAGSFTTEDTSLCECVGRSDGPAIPGGYAISDYGKQCRAWDLELCQNSPHVFPELGRWCCRPWCYADASCPNTKDDGSLSFGNVHATNATDSLVRSYSACGAATDVFPVCDLDNVMSNDVPYPGGIFFARDERKTIEDVVGPYVGPGRLGPSGGGSGVQAIIPWCYVSILCLLCWSIVVVRQYQICANAKVDAMTTQPNDFAILVSGLPKTATSEEDVANFFRQYAVRGKDDTQVVKVVIGWEWAEYSEKMRKLKALLKEKAQLAPEDPRMKTITEDMRQINQELVSSAPGIASRLTSSGTAVVVFRYKDDAHECLRRWTSFHKRMWYRDEGCCLGLCWGPKLPRYPMGGVPVLRINVKQAPNPIDINWHNLGVTFRIKLKQFVKTNAIMFLVIFATFTFCYCMEKIQVAMKFTSATLSFLPVVAIVLANFAVRLAAKFLGKWEFHDTKVSQTSSQSMKMTIGMIVCTAGVILFVNAQPREWYVVGGLIYDITMLLGFTAVMQPLFFFVDIRYRMMWCLKRRKLNDAMLERWNAVVRQTKAPPASLEDKQKLAGQVARMNREVNSMKRAFEPSEITMMRRYAVAVRTFACCLFYSPLYPMLCLLGVIGLLVQYWADKYMLLRWFRRPPEPVQKEQAEQSLVFVRLLALALPIAFWAFILPSWQDKALIDWWFVVSLVGAVLYVLFPLEVLRRLLLLNICIRGRAKIADEGDLESQDYYSAQYLWDGPEMKYHKSHFLYQKLPEAWNPEFLQKPLDGMAATKRPGVAEVMADAAVAAGSTAAQEAIQAHEQEEARSVVMTRRGFVNRRRPLKKLEFDPLPARTSDATPSSPAALPTPTKARGKGMANHKGSSKGSNNRGVDKDVGYIWEYEANHGFQRFADDCHGFIERRYQRYLADPSLRRVRVKTGNITLSVDFQRMTQLVEGTRSKVRPIRRLVQPTAAT
mmetsp:Transcript_73600/g.204539  ORF Transcript_73600/g.204539 Transcript_73600/m.204539 type:complete len:1065 (-) Transcript_73600:142-3336(-)